MGASARCKGVASSAVDARCGFIGTANSRKGLAGNGIPERLGFAAVGGALVGYDLQLEYGTAQQRPLPQLASVHISHDDTIDAAVPLLGVGSGGGGDDIGLNGGWHTAASQLACAVATSYGVVCTVDLQQALQGVADGDAILQRWEPPEHIQAAASAHGGGCAQLASVPSAQALVATWAAHLGPCPWETLRSHTASPSAPGTLRVFDPRAGGDSGRDGGGRRGGVPVAELDLSSGCPAGMGREQDWRSPHAAACGAVAWPLPDRPCVCEFIPFGLDWSDVTVAASHAVRQLLAPPECSAPAVLAALCNGEVRLIDLRMLERRPPAQWPVVVPAAAGGGGSCFPFAAGSGGCSSSVHDGGPHTLLAGDARTVLMARADGALLTVHGRTTHATAAAAAAGPRS